MADANDPMPLGRPQLQTYNSRGHTQEYLARSRQEASRDPYYRQYMEEERMNGRGLDGRALNDPNMNINGNIRQGGRRSRRSKRGSRRNKRGSRRSKRGRSKRRF